MNTRQSVSAHRVRCTVSNNSSLSIQTRWTRISTVLLLILATNSIVFYELAQLLDLQLDRKTLITLYNLVDSGVNPDSLVAILQELKSKP